ncbi:MAG: hypothetical protein ACJ8R9_31275 [Steroidobacteraceae bacterium]
MNAKRARSILNSLIQGLDPVTGNELSEDSVLHNAEVLRALLVGAEAIEEREGRETRRAAQPANVRNRWTADEEKQLIVSFQGGEPLQAISDRHGRTVRGVEARLVKLGLMTTDQRTTQDGYASIG